MSNHVKNVWKISKIPQDKIQYILNKLAVKYTTPEYKGATEEYIMDFDLIIPEPRFKKDCPKHCIVNKDSHVQEDESRPWFNWYEWHCEYWNTKWNAYDGYTKIGKTQLTFVFSTAWSFPYPVARKLEELGYPIDIRYADEDYGSNCGRLTYNPETKEWTHYDESELPDPDKFARYLWNNY